MIHKWYENVDKSHFYLGMVSQVYNDYAVVQVENLSWLKHRKIRLESLIPNTINYMIVIDSVKGEFIGEVVNSKIQNNNNVHDSLYKGYDEKIYPEIGFKINAFIKKGKTKLEMPGINTVGLTDKVYIANNIVIEEFYKHLEMKRDSEEDALEPFLYSTRDESIKLKFLPSTLFNRHLCSIGTTNSGKSTTSLSLIDKLIESNKKVLVIDPTGEYSESFSESETVTKLVLGEDTKVSSGDIKLYQWSTLFGANDSSQPALLADAIKSLRLQKKMGRSGPYQKIGKSVEVVKDEFKQLEEEDTEFEINLLAKQVEEETNQISKEKYIFNTFNFNANQWLVQKIEYKLDNSSFRNFFGKNTTEYNDLFEVLGKFKDEEEKSLYIDASKIEATDDIGALIVELVGEFFINMNSLEHPFVLFIDEVHRYLKTHEPQKETNLVLLAKEGRKKGVFLFLTTQNPLDIPNQLLGQIGTLLVHRLTSFEEIQVLKNHFKLNDLSVFKLLNQGDLVLTSINLLQDIHAHAIKSKRKHKNETPIL